VDPGGWLAFLNDLAEVSDEIALRHFRKHDLRVEEKPDLTPVTEADREIEATVRRLCRERQPQLGVYGEEEGETGEGRPIRLIIDPIDATRNFIRGIPIFATLLAVEAEGEVVAGVVSAPALATRWTGAQGCGAHEGNRPLRVSGVRELGHAQVFYGSVSGVEGLRIPPGLPDLLEASERQRGFGDFYQHVLVAAGAGEISFDPIVYPWDIAPLLVIVEEAGGRATSLEGERSIYRRSLVSSNGLLHERALELLRGSGDAQG
jgi:histidinol-phosphatase